MNIANSNPGSHDSAIRDGEKNPPHQLPAAGLVTVPHYWYVEVMHRTLKLREGSDWACQLL